MLKFKILFYGIGIPTEILPNFLALLRSDFKENLKHFTFSSDQVCPKMKILLGFTRNTVYIGQGGHRSAGL
jgi:hypothetical protein